VVFRLSPDGRETVLHFFSGKKDGANPIGTLIRDSNGNLFGTAASGAAVQCGRGGCGTVFKIDASGIFTRLYGFKGWNKADGAFPEGKLFLNADGSLFGTTVGGGLYETAGTAFRLSPEGKESVLHYFGSDADDGTGPEGLIAGPNGEMFGTTASGGGGDCPDGCGTIYKLTTDGTETILHSFNDRDGSAPLAELTMDAGANLYGATAGGGSKGGGSIYKLGDFTVLYNFCANCRKGSVPAVYGGLTLDESGYLYGTASAGGAMSLGTVYRIKK
jgi:uncharacterized repeat protein (TIGR03803 family)